MNTATISPTSPAGPVYRVGGRLEVVGVLVVEVALADVDHGQRPQRRHVHDLIQQPLAERAVAEEAGGHLAALALFGRERRRRSRCLWSHP